jgi:hypothetical protein
MRCAMIGVTDAWHWDFSNRIPVMPRGGKHALFEHTPVSGLKDSQRSKLVGSMTTSRMVIPRGRVSMNITTLATSLASSKLPDSFASFNFSSGQSARSALMTGPGEI